MEQPAWDDPKAGGTMVRGALWLMQEVGEGNTFTKNEVREAFPGISQADRRIRDLRKYGWVLLSSNQDASLLSEDQRFVRAGVPVWDKNARRANSPEKAITAKERQEIFARDGYMCTLCGISGGEPYADDALMAAVLSISRRTSAGGDGEKELVLVTECNRCRSGDAASPSNVTDAVSCAAELGPGDRRRLQRWMERGRRGSTDLDRAWLAYRRVPAELRKEVVDRLKGM